MNTNNRFSFLQSKKPIIISGPCSAESQDQLSSTAKKLKQFDVDVFRAGIWKPRTRPNGFEGFGITALEWLKNVKLETGFSVIFLHFYVVFCVFLCFIYNF